MTPTPFTIVIDTREQLAYTFAAPLTSSTAKSRRETFAVRTVVGTLPSPADYVLGQAAH